MSPIRLVQYQFKLIIIKAENRIYSYREKGSFSEKNKIPAQ